MNLYHFFYIMMHKTYSSILVVWHAHSHGNPRASYKMSPLDGLNVLQMERAKSRTFAKNGEIQSHGELYRHDWHFKEAFFRRAHIWMQFGPKNDDAL